jgi:threonine aldolase
MNPMIDLRSDTVTRPTPAMLEAMMQARVGDDVFGDDETVNALQRKVAGLFGMEAALFCPSGTMTNQIGIKVHTQPGDEVICDQLAHVYRSEGGGIAFNSGASVRPLQGDQGRFTAQQVRENINPDDPHCARTRLVTVENTVTKGGGSCWDLTEIRRIRELCTERGLGFHLDGARLFNALVARGESPRQYGENFDTISVCLSKGLGAPGGSVLLGRKEQIKQAHRVRKVFGGGMRQAGFFAAAGIYALDHHVERLAEDHAKAKVLAKELASLGYVSSVLPVETNLVIFKLAAAVDPGRFLDFLLQRTIQACEIAPQTIRMVFHLDISDPQLDQLLDALRSFCP